MLGNNEFCELSVEHSKENLTFAVSSYGFPKVTLLLIYCYVKYLLRFIEITVSVNSLSV
jgi:hypothetical protein